MSCVAERLAGNRTEKELRSARPAEGQTGKDRKPASNAKIHSLSVLRGDGDTQNFGAVGPRRSWLAFVEEREQGLARCVLSRSDFQSQRTTPPNTQRTFRHWTHYGAAVDENFLEEKHEG